MEIPLFNTKDESLKEIREVVLKELKAMENTYSEGIKKAVDSGEPDPDPVHPMGSFLLYNVALLNVMLSALLEAPTTHYGTALPLEELGDEENAEPTH
jgi:hypothetical protein